MGGARRRLRPVGRAGLGLLLLLSTFSGALALSVTNATPAFAATPTYACSTPASGGTSTTWVTGVANSTTIVCYGTSGVSGTSAYPASITLASGTLPAGSTEATSTSSSPACTTATSGNGTTEEYELKCAIADTPSATQAATPLTFSVAPGTDGGTGITSGTLTLTVSNPGTPTCIDPASGGSSATFLVGTAAEYNVECEEMSGVSGTAAYPTSITIASGTGPSDGSLTMPTTDTTGTAPTSCTQGTSGSGATEEYILECELNGTTTSSDIGSYPYTFQVTNPVGATATSGTLTVNVAAASVSCIDPASGGTATTFYENSTSSYTVECESQSGISGVSAYPSSIAIASGSLPADGSPTFATSTSSTPACTHGTSGSGATEEYILECALADTPTTADAGSYPLTFTATGAGGAGTTTSGTLTVTVQPPTTACSAPAAGGTSTTWTDGTSESYTVTCYSEGYSTSSPSNYPSSITIHSGTLPAGTTEATTTSSSPACTEATSGSGVTEEYELECKIAGTPTPSEAGTYPITFTAVGGAAAPTITSGTWNLTIAGTAPTFPADQYTNAESGQPFCYAAQAATVTVANGGLPLSNITLGAAPAGVTNWHLGSTNLNTGQAYACGTEGSAAGNASSFTVTFANSGGSATGTIDLYTYASTCGWTSTTGTVSLFNAAEDTYQNGSQSAFGQPITNGETLGTTKNEPTGCTDSAFYAPGLSGGAFTVNTANPLPSPTDTNPSATQGDLASSNLDLTTGSNGSAGGCYGDAVIDLGGGEESGSFGTASQLTLPSTWVNGGDCSYGSLGSNSAGGNTDTTNASCPPSQADVNEGYVSCSITASTGNDNNASYNNTTMDIFFNGQPVPQQPQATLAVPNAQPGDTVTVTGGNNWWGNSGGAPNAGPYGDDQVGEMYPVGAPGVFIGTSRATAVPVVDSTVAISANTYVCTGAESSTVGPNPCTMTPGKPSGTFQVPTGLAPGTYNIYIDETNTTPLPGNGPNDSYQTTQGTNLGTAESSTQLDVEGVAVVKTSTTSAYGAAGQTLTYNYAVTNTGPDTLTGLQIDDNKIPSADITCPDGSTLAAGAMENCTGTYTTTQADVDNGSVTNTATVSAAGPSGEVIVSAPSSATVLASNATSSLSLLKSTTSTGYGAAGDTIGYDYLVTNTGTTTESNISVLDNLIGSVTCPDSTLAPAASETCTGTYTASQADVDNGSVTNTATAQGTNPQSVDVESAPSSVTVLASNAVTSLSVAKSTTSTGYGAAGDRIAYDYLVTNTGTTSLSDVGVTDNLIASVRCPDPTLAPAASETCTGTYTASQADVDAGSVTNSATASATGPYANGVSSSPSSVTVDASDAITSLSLLKSTTSAQYGAAGDTIDYDYLVTNTGTTTVSNIGVTDNLVSTVDCPDYSLAPDASETCTGSYTVTQDDVDAGSVTNTATASATGPYANAVSSNPSSVTVTASGAASSLSLAKSTTSTGYGAAGDTIDYDYLVTNTGTTTLSNIGVTDNLVGAVSCPAPTLAPTASETCTGSYTVTQAEVDTGSVTNSATATATAPTNNTVTSASSTVTVLAADATASLGLAKSTTSTGYGAAGDTIDYDYLVTNTGTTTLSNISVTDNLVGAVSCPDYSLAPEASETCTGSYTVSQADVDAGSVTNTATASAAAPRDSNPVTSASSSVTVEASSATSDLSIAKSTTSTGYGIAGDTIDYTYFVTNTGTTDLSDVGVSDNLIASVSCPDSTLAPAGSETCTGIYTVTQADVDAGSVTNTASASAKNPGGQSVASGSSTVTVKASNATSELSIVKSTNSTGYGAAGNRIDYTYLVTNNGTTTLSDVGVSDNLITSVRCPDSSLAPGASETCTGSYTVTQAAVDTGSVTNTATAHATAPPNGSPVSSGSSSVTVDASKATSSLSLVKSTGSNGYGAAGNSIDYSYLITNTGTTTLSDVTVTDSLITSVSCPDATVAPGASETCTGSYTVTQAEVNSGSVTNTAVAHATNPHGVAVRSASSSVTVLASRATSSLGLIETATSTSFHAAGDVIHYTSKVANTGTETLTGIRLTDTLATSLSCPHSGLAPGASEICTGRYTVTQADVHAASITNRAVAHATNPHGSAVASAPKSVTLSATGLRITNASLPLGTVGVAYSAQLTAAGGTSHYTYRLAAGSVPLTDTLKLSASGKLTGKPVDLGRYSITVEVLDSANPRDTATADFTITVG